MHDFLKGLNIKANLPLWAKRLKNYIVMHKGAAEYYAVTTILWVYIILNWDKCISMQFFSEFDGNNILFLVALLLAILHFYDIEGKEWKVHRINSNMKEEYEKADKRYEQSLMKSQQVISNSVSNDMEEDNKGE